MTAPLTPKSIDQLIYDRVNVVFPPHSWMIGRHTRLSSPEFYVFTLAFKDGFNQGAQQTASKDERIKELEAKISPLLCGWCDGRGIVGQMTQDGGETFECEHCKGLGNEKDARIVELEKELEDKTDSPGWDSYNHAVTETGEANLKIDELLEKVEQLEKRGRKTSRDIMR